MKIRHPSPPGHARAAATEELRARFLLPGLFGAGELRLVHLHQDRLVVRDEEIFGAKTVIAQLQRPP